MEQRVIRARRKSTETVTEGVKEHLAQSLQSYAEIVREIDILSAKAEELKKSMFADMVKHNIPNVIIDDAIAERFTPSGRATNVINPKEYFNKVSHEDFFSSVSVSNTEAKKYLSGNELKRITTVFPPAPKEETLKITVKE